MIGNYCGHKKIFISQYSEDFFVVFPLLEFINFHVRNNFLFSDQVSLRIKFSLVVTLVSLKQKNPLLVTQFLVNNIIS